MALSWSWFWWVQWYHNLHFDGLVQERCNSIANALELHLSCTNSLIFLGNTHKRHLMPHLPWLVGSLWPVLYLALVTVVQYSLCDMQYRADSRFAPSQWETALLSNCVSHWLGTSLESALQYCVPMDHINGLVQDCSISSVLAMEILQSCTEPSV